jgi:hypothetical protein
MAAQKVAVEQSSSCLGDMINRWYTEFETFKDESGLDRFCQIFNIFFQDMELVSIKEKIHLIALMVDWLSNQTVLYVLKNYMYPPYVGYKQTVRIKSVIVKKFTTFSKYRCFAKIKPEIEQMIRLYS